MFPYQFTYGDASLPLMVIKHFTEWIYSISLAHSEGDSVCIWDSAITNSGVSTYVSTDVDYNADVMFVASEVWK